MFDVCFIFPPLFTSVCHYAVTAHLPSGKHLSAALVKISSQAVFHEINHRRCIKVPFVRAECQSLILIASVALFLRWRWLPWKSYRTLSCVVRAAELFISGVCLRMSACTRRTIWVSLHGIHCYCHSFGTDRQNYRPVSTCSAGELTVS